MNKEWIFFWDVLAASVFSLIPEILRQYSVVHTIALRNSQRRLVQLIAPLSAHIGYRYTIVPCVSRLAGFFQHPSQTAILQKAARP